MTKANPGRRPPVTRSGRDSVDASRPTAERWVDDEFSGRHGTTASDASIDDERHPEMRPGSPMELARKMRAEAAEGRTPVDAAKRLLEEVDRDLSGEYERRDEEEAVRRRR